jgi:hypothetical protein
MHPFGGVGAVVAMDPEVPSQEKAAFLRREAPP